MGEMFGVWVCMLVFLTMFLTVFVFDILVHGEMGVSVPKRFWKPLFVVSLLGSFFALSMMVFGEGNAAGLARGVGKAAYIGTLAPVEYTVNAVLDSEIDHTFKILTQSPDNGLRLVYANHGEVRVVYQSGGSATLSPLATNKKGRMTWKLSVPHHFIGLITEGTPQSQLLSQEP